MGRLGLSPIYIDSTSSKLLVVRRRVCLSDILFLSQVNTQLSFVFVCRAGALFNAVKKQYGLHSYLLSLTLPSPPPPPVPVPALIPRLPPPPSDDDQGGHKSEKSGGSRMVLNTLRMGEQDIQHTAKFTREFVVQSLVPWMEKCVIDWNEIVSIYCLVQCIDLNMFLVFLHTSPPISFVLFNA